MAFDRTNPAHLTILKDEVNADPITMGYAAVVNSTAELLSLLNDPANNVSPSNGIPPLMLDELWRILASETVTAADENRLDWLFSSGNLGFSDTGSPTDVSSFRTEIRDMDVGLGNKIDALVRALSRAEVLFSNLDANGTTEFVNITRDDWFAARDS